jgi:hypothetical protein
MKTIGQLMIFCGIVVGVDCPAFGCTGGIAAAALCLILVLLGVRLIRESKSKS